MCLKFLGIKSHRLSEISVRPSVRAKLLYTNLHFEMKYPVHVGSLSERIVGIPNGICQL